jgi:hypothetical protein
MVIYVYGVQFRLSKACVVLRVSVEREVLLRVALSCSSKPVMVSNGAASRESTYSSLMRHRLPTFTSEMYEHQPARSQGQTIIIR